MVSCFCIKATTDRDDDNEVNPTYTAEDGNVAHRSNSRASSMIVPALPMAEGQILDSPNLKTFTFSELQAATRNFHPGQVLGQGNFGRVFKGWIVEHSLTAASAESRVAVAVKRLNRMGAEGQQEWLTEIKNLGQLCHPNLVKLIGYCSENLERLLVYEFVPNGNLANHIFGRESHIPPLSWNQRINIALGTAKALSFLHNEANVIFRDFKASNILLDLNYEAKLCDFALAKDGPVGSKTHVSTKIAGSSAYLPPEYKVTGHLSAKTDIYSFGVVLLEMLSGKPAVNNCRLPGQQDLVEWARPYLHGKRKISGLLDANLERQFSTSAVQKAADIALQCLSKEAKQRPNMEQVVKALEQIKN